MTRLPVTMADQGIFIDPDDADELIGLLADAAWVIGHLAASPAAEDACAHAPARPGTCTDLAIDLRLAAAGLDEAATAGQENTYITTHARKGAGPGGNTRNTPRKTSTPEKGSDKLNAPARQAARRITQNRSQTGACAQAFLERTKKETGKALTPEI